MNTKVMLASLATLIPLILPAQGIRYALPSTTVVLEVDAVRETFTPGPYAAYAQELLGTAANTEPSQTLRIREIRMSARVEADPATAYAIASPAAADHFLSFSSQGLVAFESPAENTGASWRFPFSPSADYTAQTVSSPYLMQTRTVYKEVPTDTALVRIPVQEQVKVRKSEAQKAEEAAETLLKARRERMNIATGNTDATFSGEALGSALKELDRVEQQYMALFYGTTVVEPCPETYEIIPSPTSRTQRYTAFQAGGKTYTLEFTPGEMATPEEEPAVKAREFIHYRIPAVCTVRLTDGGLPLFQTRIPVYQLGQECTFPVTK